MMRARHSNIDPKTAAANIEQGSVQRANLARPASRLSLVLVMTANAIKPNNNVHMRPTPCVSRPDARPIERTVKRKDAYFSIAWVLPGPGRLGGAQSPDVLIGAGISRGVPLP